MNVISSRDQNRTEIEIIGRSPAEETGEAEAKEGRNQKHECREDGGRDLPEGKGRSAENRQ